MKCPICGLNTDPENDLECGCDTASSSGTVRYFVKRRDDVELIPDAGRLVEVSSSLPEEEAIDKAVELWSKFTNHSKPYLEKNSNGSWSYWGCDISVNKV